MATRREISLSRHPSISGFLADRHNLLTGEKGATNRQRASYGCTHCDSEGRLVDITADQLEKILAGDPDELGVHLTLVQRDVAIPSSQAKVHCHCLAVDANGRVKIARLAEFMRAMLADYAIPRSKLSAARERDNRFKQSGAVSALHHEAINLFTDLSKTGEGGEMLLYLLAERFLKMPQVLCKMDLKTDAAMHYHGADGVYARVKDDGVLKLYWGESKVYGDVADAVRDCLSSLSPFLIEPDGETSGRERDLILLSDKADLSDEKLTAAFRNYFDKTNAQSNRVQYCGVGLVAFDAAFYPSEDVQVVADEIVAKAKAEIDSWSKKIGSRVTKDKLAEFEIELFVVPMPSAESFRKAFLTVLGHGK